MNTTDPKIAAMFDAIFPDCCQAALIGLMASGLCGTKEPVIILESIRVGRSHAEAIVNAQSAVMLERAAAELAAEQQAEAENERARQEAAERQRVEVARDKKRRERAAAKKKAEQFGPRKAGDTNKKSKGKWR